MAASQIDGTYQAYYYEGEAMNVSRGSFSHGI
jgi:hypothetical protein